MLHYRTFIAVKPNDTWQEQCWFSMKPCQTLSEGRTDVYPPLSCLLTLTPLTSGSSQYKQILALVY